MIELAEGATRRSYGFDDLMRFHGRGSPAGVAIALMVLERALPQLDPARERLIDSPTSPWLCGCASPW